MGNDLNFKQSKNLARSMEMREEVKSIGKKCNRIYSIAGYTGKNIRSKI